MINHIDNVVKNYEQDDKMYYFFLTSTIYSTPPPPPLLIILYIYIYLHFSDIKKEILCYSISQNAVPILTITNKVKLKSNSSSCYNSPRKLAAKIKSERQNTIDDSQNVLNKE